MACQAGRVGWLVLSILVSAGSGKIDAAANFDPCSDFIRGPSDYWTRGRVPSTVRSTAEDSARSYFSPQPIVDLMVLYTTSARALYGLTDVERRIALGMAYLNESCRRSGVNARFRLVYQGEADWHTESRAALDELCWVTNDERVGALKEAVGADLVSLFVRDGRPTGGLALLPGAYSVFCGGAFVFTHEIGHNLGCEHDRLHASSAAPREGVNFGYSFTPPGSPYLYGDIMSYVGSQTEQFSNPNRYFMAAPTGLPEGHVDASGHPDAADNALTLNRTVPYATGGHVAAVPWLTNPALDRDGAEFSCVLSSAETGTCTWESSSDLIQWRTVASQVLGGAPVAFTDRVIGVRYRFYRARIDGRVAGAPVGFVIRTAPPGFSMVCNPLEAESKAIGALLPEAPEGLEVYQWEEGLSRWTVNVYLEGHWDDPGMLLQPGEGVIVRNPGPEEFDAVFVGEVNLALHNRVPLGTCIRSSAIPQGGLITSTLGYAPFGPGAQVLQMTPSGGYAAYTYDEDGWSPAEPVVEVGEAFWCRNLLNALIWERVLPNDAD